MIARLSRAYMQGHGGVFGIFRSKSRKDNAFLKVFMVILAIYMVLLFGFGFFSMFSVLVISDISKALILSCIYTLVGCMSVLFSEAVELYRTGKDLETLFSLPVSRRDVMLSRLLSLFEYTLLFSLVLMVPFTLAGALCCRAGVSWYIGALFLTAVLSAFTSSFLTFFAIVIPEKLRKPLYLACTVLFMFFLFRYGISMDAMDNVFMVLREGRAGRPVIGGRPLFMLSLILIPLTVLLLFLSTRRFNLGERHVSSSKSGKVGYTSHGRLVSAIRLEAQGIRQSDGILFEIMSEVFIPLIIIVVYVIMGIAGDLMAMIDEILSPTMRNSMPLLVMMVSSGLSAISSTSFSREGRLGELIGTLPLTLKDRIDGKIVFHMIIEVPACLLMLLAFGIMLKVDAKAILLSIPLLIVFNMAVSSSGLLIDIRRTYTTWSEPVEAVKKNMNVMIGFAVTVLDVLLCFLPYIVSRTLSYSAVMVWSMVLNLVLFLLLYGIAVRQKL